MSANGPILAQILENLKSINARLSSLETRVGMLEDSVGVLHNYIGNQSKVQEEQYTIQLKTFLQNTFSSCIIRVLNFGNFYEPYTNEPLTDIDGCVILNSLMPTAKITKNNKNIILDNSRIFFIEAKHAITKARLDKKLKQFVRIMSLILAVQNDTYIPDNKLYMFDNMITIHDIKKFPANFAFIFSTEKMSPDAMKIAIAIINNTLTKELYDEILLDSIKNHQIIQDIQNDPAVHVYPKYRIVNAKSIKEIEDIINAQIPSNDAKNAQFKLYKKISTVFKYSKSINSLIEPYESYKYLLAPLHGKIGFMNEDEIQLPELLIKDGFNSKNRIKTLAFNSTVNNNLAKY